MNNNMHILNPFEEFITRCGVVLFVRASSSSPKCELDWPNARGSWLKDGWSLARAVVRAPTPKGPQGKGEKKKGPTDGQSTASAAGSRKLHK